MKIEHVLFPSGFFFKITELCVGRSFSMCSHEPNFGTNKNQILKTDRLNGPIHREYTYIYSCIRT